MCAYAFVLFARTYAMFTLVLSISTSAGFLPTPSTFRYDMIIAHTIGHDGYHVFNSSDSKATLAGFVSEQMVGSSRRTVDLQILPEWMERQLRMPGLFVVMVVLLA